MTKAPCFPDYLEISYSSFSTSTPLKTLQDDLNNAFESCGIKTATPESGHPCAWDCTTDDCLFEVAIFSKSDGHIVELRRLSGCRVAFSAATDKISKHLKVVIPGSDFAARWQPLAFTE